MKKRFVSAVCAAALLASQIGAVRAANVFNTDELFEAENTTINNGMIFYSPKSGMASGGIAVYSDGKRIDDPTAITKEDLTFLFSIPQDGKYHIYMRVNASSSQGNFFYKIDDGKWIKRSEPLSWEWVEVEYAELAKGTHKFSYNHSQIAGDVDAFFITDDINKLPSFDDDDGEEDEGEITVPGAGKVIHEKPSPYLVTGNGILVEAEDCLYSSWYNLATNKQASNGKALRATARYGTGTNGAARGEIEFDFTAENDGIFNVWVRAYADTGAQDSYYAGANGYGFFGIEPLGEFVWIKSGTISLSAGETSVFKMYAREAGHLVDAFIVTPTGFEPTGRTGNFPKGEVKNKLISKSAEPPYNPPEDHPRVLFRSDDVEKIRENLNHPNHAAAKELLDTLMDDRTITGDTTGKYDEKLLRRIEAFAFDYAINGNKESGEIAVAAIIKYIDTVNVSGQATRYGGAVIFRTSEVYDWCYDLLSTAQKAKIIAKCEEFANGTEIKWPPYAQGSLAGHGAEAQLLRDMLTFAVATYNERPDIWETVGGRFFEDYVDGRDFFNKGHYALQGDSYGLYRHRWDLWSNLIIKGMGYPSPYNEEDLSKVSYSHVYLRRPDGQYMRDGDTSEDTSNSMWRLWLGNYAQTYVLDANFGNDPHLKDMAYAIDPYGDPAEDGSPIAFLVADDPELGRASVSNLPKSMYFPAPAAGIMIARTGFDYGADSDDVICEMKVGGVKMNGHQHYDCGHFQIYYKGILASDSGVYQGLQQDNNYGGTSFNAEHRTLYMIRTIAHNSMLIYDPAESDGTGDYTDVMDGGQKTHGSGREPWDFKTIEEDYDSWYAAEVEAQEIDPENPVTPEYTYIKGDLKRAYSNKIREFKRSFMFFNLEDSEVPAALVVFDKVTSSNKTFKKTWLLHGLEKPEVNGNQTVFRRTYESPVTPSRYNGKMIVDTMLPAKDDANIEIVGGEEEGWSLVNGVDYTGYKAASHVDEGNTYRMELSPKTEKETDYFLNVIQVSDNDKNYYLKPTMLETNLFYGAVIKDRAVLFSKSGTKVTSDFAVNFPQKVKATVCDVKAGEWQVTADGEAKSVVASEDGGVLSFEASGNVTFHYVGAKEKEVKEVVLGRELSTNLRIKGQYVACPTPPCIIDGKFMAPLSTLAAWFGVDTANDGEKITLSKGDKVAVITLADSSLTVGEDVIDMGVAPYEKDGEIMVAARYFVEAFDGSIKWYPMFTLADISLPEPDYSIPAEGYAVMAKVTADEGSVDGGNVCDNAIDGDGDTIWAANGIGRYIDIEFDKPTTINRVDILFNPNGGRTAKFDIYISDDGETYTMLFSDTSDGSLEEVAWEYYDLAKPVKTKYVRYMANGSNISNWNAIKEIRFRKG